MELHKGTSRISIYLFHFIACFSFVRSVNQSIAPATQAPPHQQPHQSSHISIRKHFPSSRRPISTRRK
ncbi:hypothetical protein DL95DRAFT_90097 [Leptodontidium sp. 2 PMI_412]|nr:hypothetical protein DL95DRAFT_90097 [Leptodontidium sp. 2 PMI_412]